MLAGADCEGANFKLADLSGADLSNANLRKTRFEASDLRNVDFTGATLSGTRFYGSKVAGAILVDTRLDDVEGEVDIAAEDEARELVPASAWIAQARRGG